MEWGELKGLARAVVHDTMARTAVYEAPDGSAPVNCKARLLIDNRMIGDLDREGYGRVSEGITKIVLSNAEIPSPVLQASVYFPDVGQTYILTVPVAHDGIATRMFEAALKL